MASSEAAETKCIITSLLTSNPANRYTVKQLCDDYVNTVGKKIPIHKLGFKSVEEYLRSIPDTIRIYGTGPGAEVKGVIKPKSAHINELVSKQKTPSSKHKRKKPSRYSLPSKPGYWQAPAHFQPIRRYTNVPQENHSLNHSLHNNYSPLPAHNSQHEIEDSDTTETLDSPEGVEKDIDESNETLSHFSVNELEASLFQEDELESKIPPKVQNNLRKLILKFPEGISYTDLPTEYYKMFKKQIRFEEYNYRALIEMCADLPDIFQYIKSSDCEYILYDKNKPIPSLDQNDIVNKDEDDVQENESIPKLDWTLSLALIPSDVMVLSDKIPLYFPDVKKGDYLDVSIGEIYDLSKFWLYMTFGELKDLMSDLQTFFRTHRNKYVIPEYLLEVGLYCTSLYANEYHRCVIVNLLPTIQGYVRVLFVDYGTVGNVSIKDLWYLPKQFGKIPRQAIRARLAGIKPVHEYHTWSIRAVNRFKERITNTPLVAEVADIDEDDYILEIFLADITNENDIFFINLKLAEEGFAVHTSQDQKSAFLDSNCKPKLRNIHLYPDFYEIELGRAPTISEMNYIVIHKVPTHHYMPQYFDITYHEDVDYVQSQHEKFIRNIPDVEKKPLPAKEFDYSLFPEEMLSEIKELVAQEPSSVKKEKLTKQIKIKPKHGEPETDKSVREYFCNKKRISELIRGDDKKTDKSELESDLNNSSLIQDFVPLNNSLTKLHLNHNDLPVINNITKPNKSTNPFLSDACDTNPFRTTNPFVSDIDQALNTSDLIEMYAKPLEKKVNNLNTSTECPCKINKQVNVEKCSHSSINITPTSNISGSTNPFIRNEEMRPIAPNRVRTPPGFSSVHQNNPPYNPNFANPMPYNNNYPVNNFAANNPYYQRCQQFNNMYYNQNMPCPVNQGVPGMMPNFQNFVPPFFPNQFQYNFEPFRHMYPPQNYMQPPQPAPPRHNFGNYRPNFGR